MVESIKAEIKRLQKSRQMQYHSHMENSSDGNSSEESSDSPSRSDKPLFTFKQVSSIWSDYLKHC